MLGYWRNSGTTRLLNFTGHDRQHTRAVGRIHNNKVFTGLALPGNALGERRFREYCTKRLNHLAKRGNDTIPAMRLIGLRLLVLTGREGENKRAAYIVCISTNLLSEEGGKEEERKRSRKENK
ncbi:hypothetical protein NDU88_003865 [Pleurodeles waltl]|uniref:Uncharacterized protein n=1 Tax=Pleurodeles waltl TaxID=8319 RepID=A0AAV7VI45_PLEWA|nr:hypothetical protein NDU88_003865 [Pleurodeles waltl]